MMARYIPLWLILLFVFLVLYFDIWAMAQVFTSSVSDKYSNGSSRPQEEIAVTIDQWAEFYQAKIEIDFQNQPAKVIITSKNITVASTSTLGAMDKFEERLLLQRAIERGAVQGTIEAVIEEQKKTL